MKQNIFSRETLLNSDENSVKEQCRKIREFLLENVSHTGGHLASNMGIVELTVAVHMEYESPYDKILFDVGHQCYVHKLLTGREEGFRKLRMYGGMSGYPRPSESEHDTISAGHASAALSAALGIARARSIAGEDYNVVAIIGDASISGGMAMEALNDAGRSGEPIVFILNDNEMSISRNVGALAEYLTHLRLKPSYFNAKQKIKNFLETKSYGKNINDFLHRTKQGIKRLLLPDSFFEDMGFVYMGPVDGHDVWKLRQFIKDAKAKKCPVLIHVKTVKGKGYSFSEEHPEQYHGAPKFDVKYGIPEKSSKTVTFSEVFGRWMIKNASEEQKLCAVCAGMKAGTGLSGFAAKFPKRFFDVGIAEEHAVTMSAGLSRGGMLPVCAIYSTFMQRSYDQLIHDVALDKRHVVFAMDRAGIVPGDGETHQGLFDVPFLSTIPGFTLYAPATVKEVEYALEKAVYGCRGPVAVRYPRGTALEDESKPEDETLTGKGIITVVTYGQQWYEVEKAVKESGIECEVIKYLKVLPIQTETVEKSVKRTGKLIVAEQSASGGCFGELLLSKLTENGVKIKKAKLLNAGMGFVPCGSVPELLKHCGLDSESIKKAIMEIKMDEA